MQEQIATILVKKHQYVTTPGKYEAAMMTSLEKLKMLLSDVKKADSLSNLDLEAEGPESTISFEIEPQEK